MTMPRFPRTLSLLLIAIAGCAGPTSPPEGSPRGGDAADQRLEPGASNGPSAAKKGPAVAPRADERPNVLLIVLDALRADRVAGERSGIPIMPRLRAFADESLYFTHAVAPCSWTKPSMASLFTSTYPDVHNVMFGTPADLVKDQKTTADRLPEALDTLAEVLRAAGYRASGVQTNGNVTQALGMAQGFDAYFEKAYPRYRAVDVTTNALEQLGSLGQPFLLYLHYMDPHGPYDPPEEHRLVFPGFPTPPADELSVMADYTFWYNDRILHDVGIKERRETENFSPEGEEYIRALYDGDCRFADAEVGRLLDEVLAKHPNTAVVILADHGEELFDHGSIGHGKTLYQELLHVPLVMHLPGVVPQRIDAPVELVDVLPTLAAYLGVETNPDWQGRNLLVEGAVDPGRVVYSRTRSSLRETGIDLSVVIDGPYKLIHDRARETYTLYDLSADPLEREPLDDPVGMRRLAALLEAHDAANEAHPLRQQSQQAELGEEALRNLEAQGYGGVKRETTPPE